jgi:ankyrin repeat protein
LYFKFQADFGLRTTKGLQGLHVAAQYREGIVSIYFLKDIDKYFNPNSEDFNGATPLHYAVMAIEENNI